MAVVDQREKALEVTKLFFAIPNHKRILAYILALSFIAGFIMHWAYLPKQGITNAFLYGGAEGILLLTLPALFSAVLGVSIAERKRFRKSFKYFLFIALIATFITAVSYLIGIVSGHSMVRAETIVLFGNAIVFITWFLSLFIGLNVGKVKAIIISFLHSFFNLAFLFLWQKLGTLEIAIEAGTPLLSLIKLLVAAVILLVGMWSVFFVINAPAKRNFGVSAITAVSMLFAQRVYGNKGLEELLADMGEKANTFLGTIAFRRTRDKKLKALFLVPYLHYGPVGNLGGSEFPAIIGKSLGEKYKCMAMMFHGTVTHDFNPIHSEVSKGVIAAFDDSIANMKNYSPSFSLMEGKSGEANAYGFSFGNKAFLTLSRAPSCTDDVDLGLGIALRNRALSKGFQDAVIVDRHNSFGTRVFGVGSEEYFEYEHAIDQVRSKVKGYAKLGVSYITAREMGGSFSEGFGDAGLKCSILEVNGKKACFLLFDANNITPEFRQQILEAVREYKMDFLDVLTTDTHSVNGIKGAHNPLGPRCDRKRVIYCAKQAVREALKDMEEVEASGNTQVIRIRVLGDKKRNELLSTMNSIIAVAKIIAPAILTLSIILVIAAIVLVK